MIFYFYLKKCSDVKVFYFILSYLLIYLFKRSEKQNTIFFFFFNKYGCMHLIPESLGLWKSTRESLPVLCMLKIEGLPHEHAPLYSSRAIQHPTCKI
jgi:hypothetical protein